MKARIILLALVVVAAAAQARAEEPAKERGTTKQKSEVDADNTGRNVRDRDGDTLTSGDQSENKADLKVTQEIRKAVVADDSLSTNAQNVKIITTNGVVTLRGPVESDEEKAKIAAMAEKVVGVGKVQNQLEVAAN